MYSISSTADVIGYMDLDLATDLKQLPLALDAICNSNADILYGTRLHKDSIVIKRSIKRSVISRIFNSTLKLYLGVSISDAMCGFKFLRRDILEPLMEAGAQSNNWFFSAELLIAAEALQLKIYELPVRWVDNPDSRVKVIKLSIEYLQEMQRIKRHITKYLAKQQA